MQKKPYLKSLTGLKGLCILVIVLFHTLDQQAFGFQSITGIIKAYGGYLGNYLFFMLSGFLMTYHYQERIALRQISFPDFLRSRLIKLYPLYLITNAVMFVIQMATASPSVNLEHIILHLTMQGTGGFSSAIQYNYPTWFVCALLVCYLLYYLLIWLSKNRTHYLVLLTLGMLTGYWLKKADLVFPYLYRVNGEAYCNFFAGCLLCEFLLHQAPQHRLRNVCVSLVCLLTVAVLLVFTDLNAIAGDVRTVFTVLVCAPLVVLALQCRPVEWALSCRPMQMLGSISTSIFFWHVVVENRFSFQWASQFGLGYRAYYALYLIVLLGLSALSHVALEKRLLSTQKTS